MKNENEAIDLYAKSLVKHNLYPTYDKALKESVRWHKKAKKGFIEPLLCPHHPDIVLITTYHPDGSITVEHRFLDYKP